MKLISELTEEAVKVLVEEKEGKKEYFIEGIFLQTKPNRNNRIYSMNVLEKEVARYNKEYVDRNRAYGELGHPQGPTINLERVSHMIKELKRNGDDFVGKAKIMDTPYGNIVRNLMQEGAQLGVSSRGMGSLKENSKGIMEVQDDFYLATAADIVADPSAPDAFVRGIMEGVDWVMNPDGSFRMMKEADVMRTEMKKMSSKQLEEQKFQKFQNYINSLIKN
jgi:hypothetical protein